MRTIPLLRAAVLLSALLVVRFAHAQTVTTLAGSGAFGSADGLGAAASFGGPLGMAVDWAGNVYVADPGNSRIRRVTPSGFVTTFADFTKGYPNHPRGVAVDGSGNVWEVDPVGDGIDGGNLVKLAPDGSSLSFTLRWPAVELPPLTVDDAIAIAVDPDGNLYVTSYLSGIVRFDTKGNGTVVAKNPLQSQGIAVDALGNVFVADTKANRIWKVTPDGQTVVLAGTGGAGREDGPAQSATFNAPAGIAVDARGNVFVADQYNHLIRRVARDGSVSTVAGSGQVGSRDGVGAVASFNSPAGVAVDGLGNLYVADTGNNLIRKIALGSDAGSGPWTVPSVARVRGADGSFWMSDLTLYNRSASPAVVTLRFLGNGTDGRNGPTRAVTLEPRRTATYPDVLGSMFGLAADWGALRLEGASDQVVVRSRTYTLSGGGSVGADVPAVPQSSFVTDQTQPSPVLTGLREDEGFRTNLVLVSGSFFTVDVLVVATDASGAVLGQKTYALPPFGTIQDSSVLLSPELGGRQVSDATLTLSTPTPGGAFTGIATVIDRRSNDPTVIFPQ